MSSSLVFPRRTKRGYFSIMFVQAAALIYLLSHSLIVVVLHHPTNNDYPVQRVLQDQFMNGRSKMSRLPKTELNQVVVDVDSPDKTDDLEEQYEAKVAQQGNEEVEESFLAFEGQDFNEQEVIKGVPIDLVDESGRVEEQLQSRAILSTKQGETLLHQPLKRGNMRPRNLTRTQHPIWEDEVIHPTLDDPDGLKQKLALRWDAVQCDYSEALAPPQIQLEQPLAGKTHGKGHPHLGVLIDAARHYFPLPWLYGLIDFLKVLGYDLIHFRLTDDQSFVVQLDCHPQLANTAHYNRTTEFYTAQELREWVQYAKDHGVSIMPEVNVPGHAGGWSGIPGMLYPCTKFICQTSYSIPLRVDEPKVLQIIEDVLKEVLQIFQTPPYLHLGGDEVWMSDPCFTELQIQPAYQAFENALGEMLNRLNFSTAHVARWEVTDFSDSVLTTANRIMRIKGRSLNRTGEISHLWRSVTLEERETNKPFFVSSGLYFDTSEDSDAWDIAKVASERYALNPTAVIAATFELGPCSFVARNVWGKLVAVAMAATPDFTYTRSAFMIDYQDVCLGMGLSDDVCRLEGRPSIPTISWKPSHTILQKAWAATICDRLTFPAQVFGMRKKDTATKHDENLHIFLAEQRASDFKRHIEKAKALQPFTIAKDTIYQHVYNHTGVTVDLAHHYVPIEDLHHIIDVASALGFNLLHIRLVENEFFPLKLLEYGHLAMKEKQSDQYYTETDLEQLVNYAANRGMRLMPEINFMSNAGGWHESGLLVNCPNHICDVGGPIPLDLTKGRTIATVGIVCGSLLKIFSTSPFLHLGTVNYESADPCYREAYPFSDFDVRKIYKEFEVAILGMIKKMGMDQSHIVTWESPNDHQLGGITHFARTTPVEGRPTFPFMLSADASLETYGEDTAWQIYQHTRLRHNAEAIGVIVATGSMNINAWDSRNVFGRLIAIAAGLSTSDEMDEASFVSHYITVCAQVGLSDATCNLLGRPNTTVAEWETERDSRNKELHNFKCSRFTSRGIARLPKEAVFDN